MKVNIEEREDSMGFGSIDSIEYWEYRNTFNNENKVINNTKIEAVENTAGVEVKNDSTDNIDNEILDFGKDVDLDLISSFLNEG